MGEWSDYFEDFPDENPANYVGNRFDPRGAEELRTQERASHLAAANPKIAALIRQHRATNAPAKNRN